MRAMRGPSSIWTVVFMLPVLVLGDSLAMQPGRGCQTSCGGVEIPFPFGIGSGCFLEGFEINCINGNNTPVLANKDHKLEVLSVSVMPRAEARVMLPVAFECYNTTDGTTTETFKGTVGISPAFRMSNTSNELVVVGCNTFIYTSSGPTTSRSKYTLYSGCMTYCDNEKSAQDGVCAGTGCCRTDIPGGLTDNTMGFVNQALDSTWWHIGFDFSPCEYAFIVEKGAYNFSVADLKMNGSSTAKPLVLDWAIRDRNISATGNMTCAEVTNTPRYACVSNNSMCLDSQNGPGYICHCTEGYQGNPYLHDGGCENINECDHPSQYTCHGECHDTIGSYDCKCPAGYGSVGSPKENPCTPKFPLAARLALGICLGVFFLVVALLLVFIMLQKRRLDELFEKNGGKMLENVKGLKIFTKDGLRKITKDNAEFLGNGSFGKVYKGTLPDNTMVAVKASIKVDEATKKDFVDEVEIQTNMIHKNILKLVGCCLEVDVPMLVYEFAANGSLQDILHVKKSQILSLDSRLDIAIGSAEGLKYMHCYATQVIRHGDVKPDNILLDDKLTPKISDFGLSKLLNEEQFAKTVVGCMGYIDPVFMKTGLLTQKSDVYSFGAVLLELITGKRNVYDQTCSLIIEYRKVYEKEKSGRAMFDKDIATEDDIVTLDEIGKLAMDCLKEDIEDRPDMTEVAEQLVMIRRDKKYGKSNSRTSHNNGNISIYGSPNSKEVTGTTSTKVAPIHTDFPPNP